VVLHIVVEPVAVKRWGQAYTEFLAVAGRRVLRLVLVAQVVDTQLRVQHFLYLLAVVV
jgi:hypothetical protein